MGLTMETTFRALLGTLVLYAVYCLARIGHRPKGLPPGPPTLPILGNVHLMPKKDPHLQFQKWAQQYGDVYSLILGTKTMIVLSSSRAVKDLLDKKSALYSDRPDLYTGQTLASGGKRMSMMNYGAPWKAQRRLHHNTLQINKMAEYAPYQDVESKQLLYDMMTDQTDLLNHFRRYASSVITTVVYGFRWPSSQDPLLLKMSRNLDNYTHLNMTGGAALTDFYPILRSLPAWIMSSKRAALAHYDYENKMYTDIYRASKACERPCISTHVATQQLQDSASDEDVAYIPAQLWEAGSDTTSTELYAFIQALLLYPSVQVAGHAELDAVIGQDRMPTLDDISRLPYVRACVTECLRWLPTAVLGAFPHAAMKADLYRGFTIPKDAMVVLNAWTIHRDANVYPDPEVFDPTRFLNPPFSSSSKMDPPINSPDLYAFGAGRRVCPGSNLAEQSMVLAIARIFWAFDVKKVEDEVLRQDVFEQGFVAIPSKFGVVTRPRSEGKRGLVEREWSVAREGLREGQFEEGWGG